MLIAAFMEMDLPGTGSSTHRRSKRSAPATIYPEILVIVDYDGYRLHNGDNAEIKKYFVSFWNGVDLRYKLLKGPKVRISIAGIIISRVTFQKSIMGGPYRPLMGFPMIWERGGVSTPLGDRCSKSKPKGSSPKSVVPSLGGLTPPLRTLQCSGRGGVTTPLRT